MNLRLFVLVQNLAHSQILLLSLAIWHFGFE